MTDEIAPFRVEVSEADIIDLDTRLARTRWPERETVTDWSQGVPLDYLKRLCLYWADTYDWRQREVRLNLFPQFRTEIDGLGIHFLHAALSGRGRAAPGDDPRLARVGGGVP